jgi:hypothetical protein
VQVPTTEESASAGAPTAPLPTTDAAPAPAPRPAPAPSRPAAPPAPVVASPDDWGALPTGPTPTAPAPPPPAAASPFDLEPDAPPKVPDPGKRAGKDRPKPVMPEKPAKGKGKDDKNKGPDTTPEQILAAGWRSVRRGLFWVQFALFWLSLLGFVGFAKAVLARTGNELPKGDGWIQIEGYINEGQNAIKLTKTDELNLLMYGLPVVFACGFFVLGRMIASNAPRSSGARGLFTFSALFGLLGFGAMFASVLFKKLLMEDVYHYTWIGFLLVAPLAEFWFLSALTASGVALKRPKAARAVGLIGFTLALAAFVATLGEELYVQNWRPKPVDDDIRMYEQAALLLGWLFLIGVYWRAVRNVRVAAREFLDTVEEV